MQPRTTFLPSFIAVTHGTRWPTQLSRAAALLIDPGAFWWTGPTKEQHDPAQQALLMILPAQWSPTTVFFDRVCLHHYVGRLPFHATSNHARAHARVPHQGCMCTIHNAGGLRLQQALWQIARGLFVKQPGNRPWSNFPLNGRALPTSLRIYNSEEYTCNCIAVAHVFATLKFWPITLSISHGSSKIVVRLLVTGPMK